MKQNLWLKVAEKAISKEKCLELSENDGTIFPSVVQHPVEEDTDLFRALEAEGKDYIEGTCLLFYDQVLNQGYTCQDLQSGEYSDEIKEIIAELPIFFVYDKKSEISIYFDYRRLKKSRRRIQSFFLDYTDSLNEDYQEIPESEKPFCKRISYIFFKSSNGWQISIMSSDMVDYFSKKYASQSQAEIILDSERSLINVKLSGVDERTQYDIYKGLDSPNAISQKGNPLYLDDCPDTDLLRFLLLCKENDIEITFKGSDKKLILGNYNDAVKNLSSMLAYSYRHLVCNDKETRDNEPNEIMTLDIYSELFVKLIGYYRNFDFRIFLDIPQKPSSEEILFQNDLEEKVKEPTDLLVQNF